MTSTFDRNTVISFGKYEGTRVEQLLTRDPEYLLWLHRNVEYFTLPADLYRHVLRLVASKRDLRRSYSRKRFYSSPDWGLSEMDMQ